MKIKKQTLKQSYNWGLSGITNMMMPVLFYSVFSFANALVIEDHKQSISHKNLNINCSTLNKAELPGININNYRPVLVLNFDGDGITTIPLRSGVAFHSAKYPNARKSSWFTSTNGAIVFKETIQIIWSKDVGDKNPMMMPKDLLTSFEELEKYDDNKDGLIDAKDRSFQKLFIWLNQKNNGKMIENELHSLVSLGIHQISLHSECEPISLMDVNHNIYQQKSQVIKQDGSILELYHLWLQVDHVKTQQAPIPSDISALTQKAAQGNANAQYRLGWHLRNSIQKTDHQEALKWYKLAAEQGHVHAQYAIGLLYTFGPSIEINYAEALKWHLLAAEQEHPSAQYSVGWLYDSGGYGVKRNYLEALKWFKKSCNNGNEKACRAYERMNP